jgi:hypothetical protein
MIDPIGFIESHFGIQLKKVGHDEWAGSCPWCGGKDRYHSWERGNYWCRPSPEEGHCGRKGWVDDLAGAKRPSPADLMEMRVRTLERQQKDQEKRLQAVESMAHNKDHLAYHKAAGVTPGALDWWLAQGVNMESFYSYSLGFCLCCPTDVEGRASYTIPVTGAGGELLNIRHRLKGANSGDKYRPHMAGLGLQLFNASVLSENGRVALVEGCRKAIVVGQVFPTVAQMGKEGFDEAWLPMFRGHDVFVALDPDAKVQAWRLGKMLSQAGAEKVRVANLPMKPDDMLVAGLTAREFETFLRLGRPV